MASLVEQEMNTLTGPPPESSVRDFAAEAVTGTTVEPVAKPTVNPSAAVVAARLELARRPNPSEEVTFTIEPDSLSYIGEKTQISQLKGMRGVLTRMLRTSSKDYSSLSHDNVELLSLVVSGIVAQEEMQERIDSLHKEIGGLQHKINSLLANIGEKQDKINRLQEKNRDLDYGKRDMEKAVIVLERKNYGLRKEKEIFEARREAEKDESAGSLTESDGEGLSLKRKRGEE